MVAEEVVEEGECVEMCWEGGGDELREGGSESEVASW
jgi:hypothetical protein